MKAGMIKRILSAAFAVIAFVFTSESATITDVTARQRYPWNGKVDISYIVSNVIETAVGLGTTATLNVMCIDRLTTPWTTNVADKANIFVKETASKGLTDSEALSDGPHQIVWDMNAQGLTFKSTNVIFVVQWEGKIPNDGVQLWKDGPYWAACNVGASRPGDYGCYFRWGDTVGYKRNSNNDGWISVEDGSWSEFSWTQSFTYGKNNAKLQSNGYIDSSGNLVAAHDAATVQLGAPWRIPTQAEFAELLRNCTITWTLGDNLVNGALIRGKGEYASRSIFLPACGYGMGYELYSDSKAFAASSSDYWTSTTDSTDKTYAYCALFSGYDGCLETPHVCGTSRNLGLTIRPLRGFVK